MKKAITCMFFLVINLWILGDICVAKSIYAIIHHLQPSTLKAYKITGDNIDSYPDNSGIINVSKFLNEGYGAVGIAVWPEIDRLFLTYEASNDIALASVKTLEEKGVFHTGIYSTRGLAGIVVDKTKERLYILQREAGKLYTYLWDVDNNTLKLEHPKNSDQKYHLLANLSNGYGLALDGQNGLLYVTDGTKTVRYYNTSNWQYYGEINLTINGIDRKAMGIAIDDQRGYLYTGGYGWPNQHNYIVKTKLSDPNEMIERNIGTIATGLAIDENTGYLYVTTTDDRIAVYDAMDWKGNSSQIFDPNDYETEGVSGPAGIAVGGEYKSPRLIYLDTSDSINDPERCLIPGDEITYTIKYGANGYNHEIVKITDKLPRGVDFLWCSDPNTDYNPFTNECNWDKGPLRPDDPNGLITVHVRVNKKADPLTELTNTVIIDTDIAHQESATSHPICCWEDPNSVPGVIYVNSYLDRDVNTGDSGTSWANAYVKLSSAIDRINRARAIDPNNNCGTEIWVASGNYSPGDDITKSFVIPDDISVYGGFAGNETARSQRNPAENPTTLTGYISKLLRNKSVVTMGNNTLLDGFVVQIGKERGIYCEGVSSSISNCTIQNNKRYGIYAENSDIVVSWCVIKNNGYDGVYNSYSNSSIIKNCKIFNNRKNGIYCYASTPRIIDSVIYNNGFGGTNYYGINLEGPTHTSIIRNNTIVHNYNEAIGFTGNNKKPQIDNCIIWQNNEDGNWQQLTGYQTTHYCCITDPNHPDGTTSTDADSLGNIHCNPEFAYNYGKYGYYHLAADSPCIDSGNDTVVDPNNIGEYDIDHDDRIINNRVDIGADEVSCSDVSHQWDWNGDGIINLVDFALFSNAWLHDSTEQNWSKYIIFDTNLDSTIDMLDLRNLAEVWLWQACWRSSGSGMVLMRSASSSGGAPAAMAITATAPGKTTVKSEPVTIAQFEKMLDWLEDLKVECPELSKGKNLDNLNNMMKDIQQDKQKLLEKQKELQPYKTSDNLLK